MKNLSKLQSIFIWAGGFDSVAASQCTSSEVRKMTIAGSMVFIPAFLALFSYSYCFYFIFKDPACAVIGGIVFSIILFNLDRGIMAYGRPGVLSVGLFGRVLLTIALGFLIAEPLILKIFEDSINEQKFSELILLKKNSAKEFDDKIADINTKLMLQKNRLYYLQKEYTGEMDGTGGSGNPNKGEIFRTKEKDYLKEEADYKYNMAVAQKKILEIEADKKAALNLIEANNADGLIGRMRALSNLGARESIVLWTSWILRIVLSLIELIPLLIKLSPSGDRGLYYKIIDLNDEERENIIAMSSGERIKVKEQEEKLRLTQQFAELCHKEIQFLTDFKEKDTIFLMKKAQDVAAKKLEFVENAINKISDKKLFEDVSLKFDQIHNSFMTTLNSLVVKSGNNFSSKL